MTDTTEAKPESTIAAASATAAAPSEPATTIAEPPAAMAAATDAAANVGAEPAAAKEGIETPAAGAAAAAADGVLNVRPGFHFTKLRPDFSRYRPDFSKFIPSRRSAMLAGSLGFACGIGLLVGAAGAYGIGHFTASRAASTETASIAGRQTAALKRSVAQMETQIASLKASVERATKAASTQTARLSERYDRSAHAQADLQTRVAKIGDTVDRLDKRMTTISTDITGSIARQHTASAAPAAAATPAPTPVSEPKKAPMPPVIEGWVIRDVFRGRALVESRRGLFEAAPGLPLPGLGQVESIRRQDGQWVVVTDKGLIVAARGARTHYRFDD